MHKNGSKITFLKLFSSNTSSSIPRSGGSWLIGSRPARTRDSSNFLGAVRVPFYPQLLLTIQMYLFISPSWFRLKYCIFWQNSSNILYFWPVVLRVRKKFRIAHSSPTTSAAVWGVDLFYHSDFTMHEGIWRCSGGQSGTELGQNRPKTTPAAAYAKKFT